MGILGFILNTIVIVLLALLCLILFLVLVILFVPIRYRLYADYYDNEPDINARVSWILHILHISLTITQKDKHCLIRIFGIPIMDIFHPKPKKEKPLKNKKRKPDKKSKAKKKENKGKAEPNITISLQKTQKESETGKAAEKTEENEETGKQGIFYRISEFLSKIRELLISVPDKISAIPDKVREAENKGINVKKQAENWIAVLKRDRTKKAIECAKDLLLWLFKKILPKKWTATVRFGFKDPATTAQILGYYWMFIGILTDHLTCQPEFEKEIMEGSIKLQGHIRVITFVIVGWKILFDPNLKYLRKIKAEVDAL